MYLIYVYKYKDFYNLLQFNDPIILIYNCNKNIDNIIYYQLNTFDLLFYATNDGIYYDINNIRYRIEFNVDELFGNYDILKLINKDNSNDIKFLCLFEFMSFYSFLNLKCLFHQRWLGCGQSPSIQNV